MVLAYRRAVQCRREQEGAALEEGSACAGALGGAPGCGHVGLQVQARIALQAPACVALQVQACAPRTLARLLLALLHLRPPPPLTPGGPLLPAWVLPTRGSLQGGDRLFGVPGDERKGCSSPMPGSSGKRQATSRSNRTHSCRAQPRPTMTSLRSQAQPRPTMTSLRSQAQPRPQ